MLHVVTGGSGSGKSAYAETELLRLAKQNNCKRDIILLLWNPSGTRHLRRLHVIGKCARIKVLIRWNVMWI